MGNVFNKEEIEILTCDDSTLMKCGKCGAEGEDLKANFTEEDGQIYAMTHCDICLVYCWFGALPKKGD